MGYFIYFLWGGGGGGVEVGDVIVVWVVCFFIYLVCLVDGFKNNIF